MKTRSLLLLLLLLPSISFLMGVCSDGGKNSNGDRSSIEEKLKDSEWQVMRMKDSSSSGSRSPEEDYLLRITSDSSFSLSLKVNDCQGYFRIPEKGRIDFRQMACTEMCCDPPFARDLTARISNAERYSLHGTKLILQAPDGSLTLEGILRTESEKRKRE